MGGPEQVLARKCYGYGRWDAPYWFIGLEEGQAAWENDQLDKRCEAFLMLNKQGLCDCRDFHRAIGEKRLHRDVRPPLQPTWRSLMVLLRAFLNEPYPADRESRRCYQRDHWGSSNVKTGKTCVIELSGLAATSSEIDRDRESDRLRRLRFIHEKMISCRPEFVVIYGKSQWRHWEDFWKAKGFVVPDSEGITTLPFTTIALTLHPVRRSKNDAWIDLGKRLREACNNRTVDP